jgi:hypothetical protein
MYILNSLHEHTRTLCFVLLSVCFSSLPLNAATVLDNGFESGSLSGLTCSGNCPTIATSPVSTGKYAGNFKLTPSMKTNYRTEAVMGSKGNFSFGKEYWVEFNYRYEDWAKDSDTESAPFQVHTNPSSWTSSCQLGSASKTEPFLMVNSNDEHRFLTYGGKVLWRAPIQKQKWLNLSIHFKISTGSDGFVEAWIDGVKIGIVNGPNSPKLDGCGKPIQPPYLKVGVYKWSWQTKATDSSSRQLFIDNLKITTN